MDNTTNSLAEKSRLRQMIDSYGVPRMIITGFLLLMFVLVPFAGVDFATQISNVINRFSWNAIMVLAMVPMVHSGCGLNFGLPLGIISGLLGATLSIELGFTGPMSFVMAIVDRNAVRAAARRRLRLAAQQDQGRRDDGRDLCRLLLRLLHVHDVAAAAVQEARDGVGLLRLRPSYHHLP